jgi:D-glycero-alpha-D-manno-heptose 1-phosphate guanylyltransferase
VLSLGFLHQIVIDWLATQETSFKVSFVIEHEPLGTGGGIQLALGACTEENVVILNGDTFFDVPLNELMVFHNTKQAATSLALKQMHNFDRYGVVNTDEAEVITSFEEKQARTEGNINGGVYMVNRAFVAAKQLPQKFSFEKDYLEAFTNEGKFYGHTCNGYFIDIGIPKDYEQAAIDFKTLFA